MPVTVDIRDDLALVAIDHPPVNAASQAVRAGLLAAAVQVDAAAAVRAALLLCRGRTFTAGGDITEFDQPPVEPHLTDVVDRIEAAAKPWLAAIHGSALGGGLEVAMGCRWRVAAAGARLGLPEVTLGLIPGAGGTVRLPHLVPLDLAAEMVSIGAPIPAARARAAGLIDAVLDGDLEAGDLEAGDLEAGDLEAGALDWLRRALDRDLPPRTLDRPRPAAPDAGFWDTARAAAARKHKGQGAPALALQSLNTALTAPAAAALAEERRVHLARRQSDDSRALRHVFFAERAAGKPPVDAAPGRLDQVGVIGGGTMGAGIAAAFLDAGIPVTLVERDQAMLDRGVTTVRGILDGSVKRGRIAAGQRDAWLAMLTGSLDIGAVAEADLVVEAVFEDLEVKRDLFRRLDAVCKPGAVLATNTSYIDPNRIAAATGRPEAVIGLHFFSPAHVMKLLEVVRTDTAAPQTLATAWAVAKKLGKTPVLAGVCDGFIGNRILKTCRREAEALLSAGLQPADIDGAMRGFGLPMGPFEAQDLAGLDIAAAARAAARARGQTIAAPLSDALVAAGRLGRKTGLGWYDYAAGDHAPRPSAAVAAIIARAVSVSTETAGSKIILGTQGDSDFPRFKDRGERSRLATSPDANRDPAAVQRRILSAMADEGRRILDEGIAATPAAIDLVQILGFGFPRWRGGLMYWAGVV